MILLYKPYYCSDVHLYYALFRECDVAPQAPRGRRGRLGEARGAFALLPRRRGGAGMPDNITPPGQAARGCAVLLFVVH